VQKNWFKIGEADFIAGRVSLIAALEIAGQREAASAYLNGRLRAKASGCIPYYSKGPGESRLKQYE